MSGAPGTSGDEMVVTSFLSVSPDLDLRVADCMVLRNP
jgi:hypothetical protein